MELTPHNLLLGMYVCFTIVIIWILAMWRKLDNFEIELDKCRTEYEIKRELFLQACELYTLFMQDKENNLQDDLEEKK